MATNISNPSPSHYAEPEGQALLKTTNLPEGSGQHNAERETFSSKQLKKKESEINSGTAPELQTTGRLLAFSTCEKGALPSPGAQ